MSARDRHLAIHRAHRQRFAERPDLSDEERARALEFYDGVIAQLEAQPAEEPRRWREEPERDSSYAREAQREIAF